MHRMLACLVLIACSAPPAPPAKPPADPVTKPDKPATDDDALPVGLQLPEVVAAGYDPADGVVPTVVVTPDGILGDGKPVASGEITKWLTAWPGDHAKPLVVAFDKRLTYGALVEAITASRDAGFKVFCVMANAGDHRVMVPLVLPKKAQVAPSTGLGMTVSVTPANAIVWSISGQEGTLQAPKNTLPIGTTTAAGIRRMLAEIVGRRFASGTRADEDKAILLQFDGATSMQVVAELMGAVRATADGTKLFPNVRLSAGFE
jgi:biopolymer transport protein ExbD